VGRNVPIDELRRDFDAIALCGGSTVARELPVPGSDLKGIFRAMVFLTRQNRVVAGDDVAFDEVMSAEGKHVVVIGGGDTGSDCIGTSVRQGAKSITQLEIMPRPPAERHKHPWPLWPFTLNVSSSHEEAQEEADLRRMWCVNTKEYLGEDGRVKALKCVRVEWEDTPGGRPRPVEVPGSEFEIQADLVLLAMGFVHPEHGGLIEQLGVELDERGNVATGDPKHTNVEGVFAAGDMRRGQSLVVTALAEGRDMAYDVDEWLMGESILPRSNPR
jgi:glutamate synthase (NADPH/NADH) small chain